MVEELSEFSAGEFQGLTELFLADTTLQVLIAILGGGLLFIAIIYHHFGKLWDRQEFSYTKPHVSGVVRSALLGLFLIGLVTVCNTMLQVEVTPDIVNAMPGTIEKFTKVLNTINILVVAFTVAKLMPIVLNKTEKTKLEKEDFEKWKEMKGFADDEGDLFYKIFKWIPPKTHPEDMTKEEFEKNLQTKEGINFLENYRTGKGVTIGSYEKLVEDPFGEWKKAEREKYKKYLNDCLSGNNETGRKLTLGAKPQEIYPIDTWREEKRLRGYDPIIAAAKPAGHAELQQELVPKTAKQILPVGIIVASVIGVVGWWGVDLFVLATATGGLALGVGLALKETLENYFAYILIRKDKVFTEGDRIQLASGYNGIVHRITPRVTYIRHALNESLAIIPTRQLVTAEIINYTKEIEFVPAIVDVGVSYLNDPKQVASILVKVGKRALIEVKDSKGNHVAVQKRCPYLDQNKPSCGCDKNIHIDIEQPTVRFNKFNDSSLDFSIWVYVRSYGAQFKMKSTMRLIMYEEFKKYDIRIPWPIRTVYQGDEKREEKEIAERETNRKQVVEEFGIGDLSRGEGD